MKVVSFIIALLFSIVLVVNGQPVNSLPERKAEKFVSLTPDFSKATLFEGRGKIPFTIKNNLTEDIVFTPHFGNFLMTTNEEGKEVTLLDFRDPNGPRWGGGPMVMSVELKPGESKTYDIPFSMDTMAFVAGRNKQIFGQLSGHTAKTNRLFTSQSEPFTIPPELTRPPWVDLGKQSYLSIMVDAATPNLPTFPRGPNSTDSPDNWGGLSWPIKITNVTEQPFIVNSVHVSFCKADDPKAGPDLWELVRDLKPGPEPDPWADKEPLLKPGETIMAGGRSYIICLPHSKTGGWKEGEKNSGCCRW